MNANRLAAAMPTVYASHTPAFILMIASTDTGCNLTANEAVISASLVLMYFILAMRSKGIISILYRPPDSAPRKQSVDELCGLQRGETVLQVVALGYPDSDAAKAQEIGGNGTLGDILPANVAIGGGFPPSCEGDQLRNSGSHFSFSLGISLPGSERTGPAIAEASKVCKRVYLSESVIVHPDDVSWGQVRGMEAYNRSDKFRNAYIPRALGCRLAGLKAIETAVSILARHPNNGFLIFQEDMVIPEPQALLSAIAELPEDVDCLWFDTNQIKRSGEMITENLRRVFGAKLCTGVWMSARYARSIVERLRGADCEWDLFMEGEMSTSKFYAPNNPLCYQRRGVSLITGQMKWAAELSNIPKSSL